MLVIIPMVGRGTRTRDFWDVPKPLIEILGKPLAQHSIESLGIDAQYVFVIREFSEYPNGVEHTKRLYDLLKTLKPTSVVFVLPSVTDGPARSAIVAKDIIPTSPSESLVITNCDHILRWESNRFLKTVETSGCDGCVTTFPHTDSVSLGTKSPYSFIKLDPEGFAERLEEKVAISPLMLNGIHYWKHAEDFVSSCEEMIQADDRVNDEFYISRTYNYLIDKGKKVIQYPMDKGEFFALGTTGEITYFLENHNESFFSPGHV